MRKAVSLGLFKASDEFASGMGILLLKHVKCKGMLMMPCGKVEEGEEPVDAIVREMKEELGIDLSKNKHWSGTYILRRDSYYERIDKNETFDETVYMCKHDKQEIINMEPEKAEFIKWYDLAQVAISDEIDGCKLSNNTKATAKKIITTGVSIIRACVNLINWNMKDMHMKPLKVKKLHPDAIIPQRAHVTDSGMDLYSTETITLWSGHPTLVHTGIAIELEPGYEAQVRSKSGLALKNGLFVLNSPGTVDHNYSGEIGVIIYNGGPTNYKVEKGQKIAQLVIQKVELPEVVEVEEVYKDGTERGDGGFGSTGRN